MFNLRKDFPFLSLKSQIYFDNAATSQKPQSVIDAISQYYKYENAPVHRGIYSLAEQATILYEQSRATIAEFIGAESNEIVFTKGTTEGINFIASTWASSTLREGDEIILTELEHHSNILPWVRLAQQNKLKIKYIEINQDGTLDYESYLKILNKRTKLVAFTHESNALGTKVDAEFIIKHARNFGSKVLVDAAQTIGHGLVDIKKLQPDFLVFSGHKMLGPTGIGVLYISKYMQEFVEPYQLGGGMVFELGCDIESLRLMPTWLKAPHKYEAGTPPIAQAIGLAAAVQYLKEKIDFEQLRDFEAELCARLINGLLKMPRVRILGPIEDLRQKGHIVSFVVDNIHAHDIAAYLDTKNISVRAGNHCAQLLFKKLKIDSSVRVSFYLYNTIEEVDQLLLALHELLS